MIHARLQHLVASIREWYWKTLSRILANQIIREEYVNCQRFKPKRFLVCLNERANPNSLSYVTGLDYAWPFSIPTEEELGCKNVMLLYLLVFR